MATFKVNRAGLILALLCGFLLNGCALAVVGIGVGIGAAAYSKGNLTKTYESSYHDAVNASRNTLIKLKIPEYETTADELETVIKAKRPDGTPVTIEVVRIADNLAKISVRTGQVGVSETQVSEQIQAFIEKELTGYTTNNNISENVTTTKVSQPSQSSDVSGNAAMSSYTEKPKQKTTTTIKNETQKTNNQSTANYIILFDPN